MRLDWRRIRINCARPWLALDTGTSPRSGLYPGTLGTHADCNAQGRFQSPTAFFTSCLFFHHNLHYRIQQSGCVTRTAVVSCFNCAIQGFRKGILDFVSPVWNVLGLPTSPPHLCGSSSQTRKPSWAFQGLVMAHLELSGNPLANWKPLLHRQTAIADLVDQPTPRLHVPTS